MAERIGFPTATSSQAVVTLSTPKPRLSKGFWSDAVVNFRRHIDNLINPFVVRDLVGVLRKIKEGLFDPEEGIIPYFKKLIFPLGTRAAISQFVSPIKKFLNHDCASHTLGKTKNKVAEIYHHLSQSNEVNKRKLWKYLSMLCQLREVEKLESEIFRFAS